MSIYKESADFYEGVYEQGKTVLFLALAIFSMVAPVLAWGLVQDFNWFDLVAGVLAVLVIFVWAIKASEYEEAMNNSARQLIVTGFGREFYVGQKYVHTRKGDVYRLLSVTNKVNSSAFPVTAVYQNEQGEVFSRSLYEFSAKFVRYDTEE